MLDTPPSDRLARLQEAERVALAAAERLDTPQRARTLKLYQIALGRIERELGAVGF